MTALTKGSFFLEMGYISKCSGYNKIIVMVYTRAKKQTCAKVSVAELFCWTV